MYPSGASGAWQGRVASGPNVSRYPGRGGESGMSVVGERSRMYVGGAWIGAASGKTMRVTNPATGEPLADLPDASRDDVGKACDEAAKAFPKWAATPALERGKILGRGDEPLTHWP